MAYTSLNFVPGEILTAAKMNLLAANDASFRDGTGIGDDTIQASKLNWGGSSTTNFNFQATFSSDAGSMQLTLRRWGNLGFINGRLKCSGNMPTSTTTAITGIPSNCRPRQEVFWTVMGSSGSLARAIFDTSGNIKVNMLPSQGSTNYLQFGEVYLI